MARRGFTTVAVLVLAAVVCAVATGAGGRGSAADWRAQTHTKSGYSPGVAADKLALLHSGRVGAVKRSAVAKASTAANDLTGAWVAVVQPPAPAPPVRSFQVFSEGGTWVEVSNEPQATRSPMVGAWERIGGRLYAATGVHHRFNPQTGAAIGWWKIDRTIELSQDGQSCTVVARITQFDTAGNVVGTFAATATATRLAVDRIP